MFKLLKRAICVTQRFVFHTTQIFNCNRLVTSDLYIRVLDSNSSLIYSHLASLNAIKLSYCESIKFYRFTACLGVTEYYKLVERPRYSCWTS